MLLKHGHLARYIYLDVVFLLENLNVGKEKRSSYEWIPPSLPLTVAYVLERRI
jgi:hypothetical protein